MRRRAAPDSLFVGNGWSAVLWRPDDGEVEPLVARMRELPGHVEWKYYSHDGPELRERLVAAGLEPDDEETVVVAEVASIPPPPDDVELRIVRRGVRRARARRFSATGFDLPEKAVAVVAVRRRAAGLGRAGRLRGRTSSSRACSAASRCPSTAGAGSTARRSPSARSSRASAATAGSTPTRCRRAGRSSSGSASSDHDDDAVPHSCLQLAELLPARVEPLVGVLVRLGVEVLAADGTETGAVGPAEDLVGQRERDRVVRPGGEVELVVGEVLRRAPRRSRASSPRTRGGGARAAARRR